MRTGHLWLFSLAALVGCSPGLTQQRATTAEVAQQKVAAAATLAALKRGEFDQADTGAGKLLESDPKNAYGHVVRAITRYKRTMHQLSTDLRTVVFGAFRAGGINHRYLRSSLEQTAEELAAVDRDLAAADHPDLSLELCLACWEVDWNHNGRVDRADRLLFQIERDADGKEIPEDDPRRKPTFRFDHGDVAWARAFVNFQRGVLELALAYRWTELDRLFRMVRSDDKPTITLRIEKPERVAAARARFLEALDQADRCREAYLAETDDDREWVPNPRQKSHPLPLPVDEALYSTWRDLVRDLRELVRGREGLSVEQVAQLGDHRFESPPRGYVDIGRMLSKPRDIVIKVELLQRLNLDKSGDVETLLRDLLGDYYVQKMTPSPITRRFVRMKKEVQRGEETLERKLRYLIWLN